MEGHQNPATTVSFNFFYIKLISYGKFTINVAFKEKKVPLSKRKVIVLLHLHINSFQISLIRAIFSFIAVIWIKDPLLHEVSVAGLRQGVTKKNLSSSKARYMVFPFYYIVVNII